MKLQNNIFKGQQLTGLKKVRKTAMGSNSPEALKKEVLFQNSTDFQERTEKNDSSTKMFIYWHGNKFTWITKFPSFLKVKKFKKIFIEHLPHVQCSDH